MKFIEGQPILYKGIGENQWYHGTYVQYPASQSDKRHVLRGIGGYKIHRETKNVRPLEIINNRDAKSMLEVDY